jgi:hypothetical protein
MSEQLNDANEIRKLLDEVAYGARNIDGEYPSGNTPFDLTNSLVRRCFDLARYTGMSGEDRMTVLAYHALLAYKKISDEYLHFAEITPKKHIILKQT